MLYHIFIDYNKILRVDVRVDVQMHIYMFCILENPLYVKPEALVL
mgnify:CR=1 FL=1